MTHQGRNHLPAFQNRREYIKKKKKVQTFGENFHSILEKVSNSLIKNWPRDLPNATSPSPKHIQKHLQAETHFQSADCWPGTSKPSPERPYSIVLTSPAFVSLVTNLPLHCSTACQAMHRVEFYRWDNSARLLIALIKENTIDIYIYTICLAGLMTMSFKCPFKYMGPPKKKQRHWVCTFPASTLLLPLCVYCLFLQGGRIIKKSVKDIWQQLLFIFVCIESNCNPLHVLISNGFQKTGMCIPPHRNATQR